MQHRVGHRHRVHHRLDPRRAVRLRHPFGHRYGHLGQRVADVDLPAGDVERPPVEADRPRDPRHRVFRGRVADRAGPRRVGRDRAVVDDPPALRRLRPHDAEGRAGAQEDAGHVDLDHPAELVGGNLVGGLGDQPGPGVVEEHVQPAPFRRRPVEGRVHRTRVADVAGQDQRAAVAGGLAQRLLAPADQPDPPAGVEEPPRRDPADAAARAGDDDPVRHRSAPVARVAAHRGLAQRGALRRPRRPRNARDDPSLVPMEGGRHRVVSPLTILQKTRLP